MFKIKLYKSIISLYKCIYTIYLNLDYRLLKMALLNFEIHTNKCQLAAKSVKETSA